MRSRKSGYERADAIVNTAHALVRRFEILLLILAVLFTAGEIADVLSFTAAGRGGDDFPGFEALRERNEDIAGWIIMDGTHINHPVLHGEDNFEYLSRDPDGEYYQGGSIFLDSGNAKDFSDQYIIIHGHHMSRGAMFSDIAEYINEEFFNEHARGMLITPGGVYELTAAGSRLADAYEGELYYTGKDAGRPLGLIDDCAVRSDVAFEDEDKLVVLSTCAGDMTNTRAVLFCRARYIGEKYAEN